MTATNRETWLNELAGLMAPRFAELGHPLPAYRLTVGFTSLGMNGGALGECWSKVASADGHFEIFITPGKAAVIDVAYILAHELTHAAVGLNCGHKGDFQTVALALGFTRPLTTASAPSARLLEWVNPLVESLGAFPHAALSWREEAPAGGKRGAPTVRRGRGGVAPDEVDGEKTSSRKPKQGTRLIKATCEHEECGYNVRVTARWLKVGPPHCPVHGAMSVGSDEGEDAGE